MKNPHDKSEYTELDKTAEQSAEQSEQSVTPEQVEQPETPDTKKKPKHKKFSGAYYYVDTDEKKLAEQAFIRTTLTLIAFFLQLIILFLPQGSLEYITLNIPSYAYFYVMTVFVMIGITIWLIIMGMTKYKFKKRIPVEYAPKKGFGRRAFFGNELYIAINAFITVLEISFACIKYDHITLVGIFISAAATAAAVFARQVTHLAFKNAELIPAPNND